MLVSEEVTDRIIIQAICLLSVTDIKLALTYVNDYDRQFDPHPLDGPKQFNRLVLLLTPNCAEGEH